MSWNRWLALIILAIDLPIWFAASIFVWANGLGWSGLSLLALCILLALPAIARRAGAPASRRALAVLAVALLLFDVGFAAFRLKLSSSLHPRLQLCANGDCAAPAPLFARLADEGEAARAGLYLSRLLGLIGGEEFAELDHLLVREYGEMAVSPELAGVPDVIFAGSSPGIVRYLQWVPPDRRKAPCIVFLHGFGGELSAYLKVLIESELGREAVIMAPILDYRGRWWQGEGQALVIDLIRHHLPPEADPDRLFLAGLSNGGIGATDLALSPQAGPRFLGAALISGIHSPAGRIYLQGRLLAITGSRDERFPVAYVREQVAALAGRGVHVDLNVLDGTHLILLSHKEKVTGLMRDWMKARPGL